MATEDTDLVSELTTEGQNGLLEKQTEVIIGQEDESKYLIYGVNDVPPIHITIICALQQVLLALSSKLIVSLLVAEAVCASDNDLIKAKLLSSALVMSGVTTVAMCLLGVRLPQLQGAKSEYIVPLLLVANNGGTFCTNISPEKAGGQTLSNNSDVDFQNEQNITEDRILYNIQALQGSLVLAGLVHAFFGFTGLIGFLLRFIGPLTIVPTLLLIFIFVAKPVVTFIEVNWPIALSTIAVAVILCVYLANHRMPIPIWTPSDGCRIIRYPLHQVFAILISICVNWFLCYILTQTGVLTDDPNNIGYKARTDARSQIIEDNPWFTLTYPGQWGSFGFDGAAFISFMVATMISILDSIGDYYACARVASRQVFVWVGIMYIVLGLFGKASAIFITIPYPVLGGAMVVMLGIFIGVVISNLEVTSMASPRNISVLGLATFIGLLVPTWVAKVKTPINTGMDNFDSIMTILLGNPNFVGTILAFILDNTVPGTEEERGIAAWQVKKEDEDDFVLNRHFYDEGYEVYQPWLPRRLLSWPIIKHYHSCRTKNHVTIAIMITMMQMAHMSKTGNVNRQ